MDVEDSRQRLQEITLSTNNESQQNEPNHEDQVRFNKLWKSARKAAEEGQPRVALDCYRKAAKIHETDRLMRRIAKLEAYLKEYGSEDESEEEDSGMVHVGKGFSVYKDVYNKMYPHQREAMLWFWRLHRKQKGGILGDDMGLGKTIQVIAYLSGLFDMDQVHAVMLILPVAVIVNWEKEFEKWAPGIRVESFHSGNKRERLRCLAKVQRHGGVLMTSYGLVVTNWENLGTREGREFVWDYVILDEGHKIKNPSKTTKACHAIVSKHRFILSGTPIQNNLKEFWHLFDFVTQGTLLGTQKTFQMEYAGPITRAREKDATPSEKLLGNQMAESLRQLIAPYFLRRTKADVLEKNKENQPTTSNGDCETDVDGKGTTEKVMTFPTLTRKNDFVVWCFLTEQQIKIYKDFLELDQVKELLMTTRSPLVELTVLKKLCDHLRLLSLRACMQLGMDTGIDNYDEEDDTLHRQSAADKIQHMSNEQLLAESGKLQLLMDLLKKLSMDGHRTLVFSQSRKMLDIIEKLLKSDNFKYLRMDGTISKLDDRQQRINSFQNNRSYSVFLLTTQVGGVGLTLTGADRVVIFDPSWNPATDNQAVDRVYRIGQKETVVVYRLITCGTVEEKIYRRQIFKESINKQTVGCTAAAKNPYRYFTRGELKELFTLDNPKYSTTQVQLEQMHAAQRKTDIDLDEHIAFLYSLEIFGITDHDLMFSKEAAVDHGADDIEEADDYIQQRVMRAQELVSAESDLKHKLNARLAEDTEFPGANNRRHTLYTDRQQLLDEAARQGHQVELPQQRPRWQDRPPLDQPTNEVVELDRSEDSFDHNDSRHSSSGGVGGGSGGNDDQSFLQEVINNLSQEEIELNMRLLEENKRAQQVRVNEENHLDDDKVNISSMDESSVLEDIQISSSSLQESSFEEVEVADQSMQADQGGSQTEAESSMEEVEVADQSLQASFAGTEDEEENGTQVQGGRGGGEDVAMNVSMRALSLEEDVANLSMEDLAKADTLDVCDDLDLHIPTPSKSSRKSFSAIPSPAIQDKSKQQHHLKVQKTIDEASFDRGHLDKTTCLVVESPLAVTPVLSDELEMGQKRKSSDHSHSSDGKRKYVVEEEEDDEIVTRPHGVRDRAMRIQDLEDEDDSIDNSDVFLGPTPNKEGVFVIQDSEDEESEEGEEEERGDKSNTSELGSYLTDIKNEPLLSVDESSLKIPTPKEMLQHKFDNVSLEQSELGRERSFDKQRLNQRADRSVNSKDLDLDSDSTMNGTSQSDYDLKNEEENDAIDKEYDLDHDATVDGRPPPSDEELEEEEEEFGSTEEEAGEDARSTSASEEQESINDSVEKNKIKVDDTEEETEDDEIENDSVEENTVKVEVDDSEDGEEDYEEDAEGDYEDDDEENEDMECNSEDSYEEEEEEDAEEDDYNKYAQLVSQGEKHLSKGDEAGALPFFLQALKIDKSDKTLQMRTLKLYQKLTK